MNFMRSHLAIAVLSGLVLISITSPAGAQKELLNLSPACQPEREAIINLRPPFFGTPSIWDGIFSGPDGRSGAGMRFSVVLPGGNGTVIAGGEVLDADFNPTHIGLMRVNARARVIAHQQAEAKPGERLTAMIPFADGYMASSAILSGAKTEEKQTRILWFDKDFALTKDIVLKDGVYDYVSLGLIPAAAGQGVLVLVQAVHRKNPVDQYGMIFRLDAQGKTLWKRSYRPGISNIIYGVTPTLDGHYIATGSIRNEDGRMAGWVLLLDGDGTIMWQRSYPRGSNAILRMAATKNYLNQGPRFIMTGQIMPFDNNPGAVWVMETDNLGAPIWQRYMRTNGYDFDGRALAVYEDGRSTIVANAKAAREGFSDHIRLLTMTPRGQVMEDESYMEGVAAHATYFSLSDNAERLIAATIQTSNRAEKEARKVELITDAIIRREQEEKQGENIDINAISAEEMQDIEDSIPETFRTQGWVFAATPLGLFDDPCIVTVMDPAQ